MGWGVGESGEGLKGVMVNWEELKRGEWEGGGAEEEEGERYE